MRLRTMTRLITAPCIGFLIGALEEGSVFAILTIIDQREHHYVFLNGEEGVYLAAVIGMILGGFMGGLIGLVVALKSSDGRSGLLLGGLIGLAFMALLVIRVGFGEMWNIVEVTLIPAGASIGFLSAVATAPRKGPSATADVNKSGRIFS